MSRVRQRHALICHNFVCEFLKDLRKVTNLSHLWRRRGWRLGGSSMLELWLTATVQLVRGQQGHVVQFVH